MTLRTQILALILLLAVLIVAGTTFGVASLADRELKRQIGGTLAGMAAEVADRLDRDMATRMAEVDVLAAALSDRDLGSWASIRGPIDSLQNAISLFSWIGVIGPDGSVVAATDGILEGVSIAHRPVFTEGRKGLFIGDVHDAVMLANLLDNPTGEPIKFVDIARPIAFRGSGKTAVLAVHLSWHWAGDVTKALLENKGRSNDVDLFVVAADRTVLLSPDPALTGTTLDLQSIFQAAGGNVGWNVESWPDGIEYLTGFTMADGHEAFTGFGWTVLARQPVAEAFAPVQTSILKMAAIGLVVTALAVAIGWWLSARVVRPLNEMTLAVQALRQQEADDFPDVNGPQEIRILSNAFRQLIRSLIASRQDVEIMTDKAMTDPLTGLANRSGLERFLENHAGLDAAFSILIIDLDGFKSVNDAEGHNAGDRILRMVADRLNGCVRSGDLVARIGGDEFLIIAEMRDPEDDAAARVVAHRIVDRISRPFDLEGPGADSAVLTSISASVGLARYPRDGQTTDEVIKCADVALFEAKRSTKGHVRIYGETRTSLQSV